MWNNIVEPDKPQMTTWAMPITQETQGYNHTLSICNSYWFSSKQWLPEGALSLLYTYIAFLISTALVYSGIFYNTFLTEYDIGFVYEKIGLWS
jgi:hypothetical protein